jgi:hypothetical protein
MMSSPETNDAAPAIRGVSDASPRRGELRPSCIVCQAEIVDNNRFCRLSQNGNGEPNPESLDILLCSPRCALRHFASLRPHGYGFDSDFDEYENSVHFLMAGEKPV